MRPEGFINTPPVAIVVSPQYAVVNQTTQITIPVSDPNAGDDVRCRWSVQTTSDSSVVSTTYEIRETIKSTSFIL
jgi:hypothetical protein